LLLILLLVLLLTMLPARTPIDCGVEQLLGRVFIYSIYIGNISKHVLNDWHVQGLIYVVGEENNPSTQIGYRCATVLMHSLFRDTKWAKRKKNRRRRRFFWVILRSRSVKNIDEEVGADYTFEFYRYRNTFIGPCLVLIYFIFLLINFEKKKGNSRQVS